MELIERKLPERILSKAPLKGNEFAWYLQDLPEVITISETLDLLNVGGQLQFRFPNATFECY